MTITTTTTTTLHSYIITSTTTQVTDPPIAKLPSQIITTNQRHIFRFSKRPNTPKHKYVDTTYPLDSLASDRALGSTCPLLSGLIHQLPTLKNPHKNTSINTNPYKKIKPKPQKPTNKHKPISKKPN